MVNSPLRPAYQLVHHTLVAVRVGSLMVEKPLILWINEGLMVFFFLLVAPEIKREVLEGHLDSPARIALPALAALGGLLSPAAIYLLFTWSDATAAQAWAIPSATDTVLALAAPGQGRARGHRQRKRATTARAWPRAARHRPRPAPRAPAPAGSPGSGCPADSQKRPVPQAMRCRPSFRSTLPRVSVTAARYGRWRPYKSPRSRSFASARQYCGAALSFAERNSAVPR